MNQAENQLALSTLDSYRGRQRLLLIFAPAESDTDYQRQKALLPAREVGAGEGELVIFHLFADGESTMGGTQSPSELPEQLRQHFGVAEDEFALVLLDKTGAVKLRKQEPVPLAQMAV
jgi:hypothetical protein